MSLSKSKCWFSNNCLHFFRNIVPLMMTVAADTNNLPDLRGLFIKLLTAIIIALP